jgi:hypothetical protein
MKNNAKTLFIERFGVAIVLLALSVVPCARAGDAVCFDAVTAEKIEAPMAIAAASNAPAEYRDQLVKGASGGLYLQIAQGKGYPPNVTTGMALFTFTVAQDGDYYLWCRTWWLDECGNSFSMSIDDARPFIFGEDSTFKSWHWVRASLRLKQLTLTKGKHTLTVRNREDGVYLNQILLTLDKKYVPVDVEPVTPQEAP